MMFAMKSRALRRLACLLGFLPVFTACRSSHSVVAVIPRDAAEEIWVSEHGGAADAAAERHLTVYWNGPSRDDDVEQQISLSERAVHSRDAGLVLSPNNAFALDTLIERALSRDIPVVIVGDEIPIAPQRGLSFVINDVNQTGLLIARRLEEILGGRGKIVLVGADPLSPGRAERAQAIEDSLSRLAPGITIAQKFVGPFSFGQAELTSEQVIQAHSDLSAIVALGVKETRGAVAAVHNTGKVGRIMVIGCDQTLDLLLLLRRGLIDSLVVEDTRTMGYVAVKQIEAEQHGQSVPAKTLVPPSLVTVENVDNDHIQQILDSRWRPRS
jgi:ribose transport system substrate-binding protein